MTAINPDVLNPQRRTTTDSIAAIKGSMGDIKESVGDVVQNQREHLQQKFEHGREQLQQKYEHGREQLQEKIEHGKERLHDAKSGLEGFVRERPVTSLMIAAGAGALLGYALSRRR